VFKNCFSLNRDGADPRGIGFAFHGAPIAGFPLRSNRRRPAFAEASAGKKLDKKGGKGFLFFVDDRYVELMPYCAGSFDAVYLSVQIRIDQNNIWLVSFNLI